MIAGPSTSNDASELEAVMTIRSPAVTVSLGYAE